MLTLNELRKLARESRGRLLCSFARQLVYIPDTLTVRIPRHIAMMLIEKGWVEFVVNVEGNEIVYTPVPLPFLLSGEKMLRTYVLRRFTCSKSDRFGLSVPCEAAFHLGADHGELAEVQIWEKVIVVRPLGIMGKRSRVNSLVKRRGRIIERRNVAKRRAGRARSGLQEARGGGEKERSLGVRADYALDRNDNQR